MVSTAKKNTLDSLTSFRFFAALMVFFFHMGGLFSKYQLGSAGVQFFFILSGFIMTINYHSKFEQLNSENIKKFYKARFAKIFPTHFLTFLIAAPLTILYFHPNGLYFVKLAFMSMINLLLIQSFIPNQGTYFNFNGVSWTLSVETFFYIMFPFILFFFIKLKIHRNIITTGLTFFAVWIFLFALNIFMNENNPMNAWMLHILPITRLFDFATGMLLGLLFANSPRQISTSRSSNIKFNILEFLSVIGFMVLLIVSIHLNVAIVRGVYFMPIWCLLIFTFAYQKGIISRILSNKILVYLGEISFSFYMIHQLVIRYFEHFNVFSTESFSLTKAVTCFVVAILLSSIMFRFYEEPLRKMIRFGFTKREKSSTAVPVKA